MTSRTPLPPGPENRIDLFVVGAMKAATTGMCEWLDVQPGVVVAQPKEPSIFVSDEAVDERVPYIETLFPDAGPSDVRVDGSTDYAKFPAIDGVPERLRLAFPDAKLVYMMRHPVERLVSQYRFEWFLGNQKRPLADELERNAQMLDNSRYAVQVAQWLRCFDRDRLLLVFAEAFAKSPETEVARVLDFAGVAHADVTAPHRERANETTRLVRPTLARRIYRRSKVGKKLRPLVPARIVAGYRERLDRASRPEMTNDVRRRLETIFDEDLRQLSDITGGPSITCQNWHDVATSWTPTLISP